MRLTLALLLCFPVPAANAQEALWYIRNNEEGIRSFEANASRVSIIGPQVYSVDSMGNIRGGTDPRIVDIARRNNVKLMPLVMNPGFDVGILHRIVTNRQARTRTASEMARICRDERVWGLQLDFENIHTSDRDAFTAFSREIADSVRGAGCGISAAVVPRTDDSRGVLPYHNWMMDYWRGAYDYKALAESLDFISYMTYAQHAGGSTPGPVAGFEWMRASLQYVLSLGVPPEKISLGIPAYSDYWFPHYNPRTGDARVRGDDISYTSLMRVIGAAGATPQWDDRQKAWFAMWERNGVFEHAWIEDARAFREKLALVHENRLRGYSVWLMGMEDSATWSVVGRGAVAAPRLSSEAVVREFMGAYNRHDVAGMMQYVDSSITWLTIAGDSTELVTRGRQALREEMTRYFARIPSARSKALSVMTAGNWVTVHECAVWERNGERRAQSSVAIYELKENRIVRVWYTPLVRESPEPTACR